ncbi:DUF3606 domain-containing protein [Nitratireductor thuwali]|uniref:DUF3606 domain-containing protein n=1 Tax=Nitratireductor thuwali TaxID=2267699 RepID=A0ABY5MP24_9HYPH|nr:hypothetical protein NTH_02853 [Nitratireductor thuwali]
MADDKSKRGPRDRARVALEQPYEVSYFRKKHDLSLEKAKDIIERHGPNREKANEAAEHYKKRR